MARIPLTSSEQRGVVVAAQSAFFELASLYEELLPIFNRYGFKPQSAGVVSRDVSEQTEQQIILHSKIGVFGPASRPPSCSNRMGVAPIERMASAAAFRSAGKVH